MARAAPLAFWARPRLRPLLGAVAVLALSLESLLRRPEDWQIVYLPAGRLFLDGRDIYDVAASRFTYPPAMALAAAAFTTLPGVAGRLVWVVSNAAAVALLWWCSWRTAGGGRATGWRENAPLWLGMAVSARFVTAAIEHQQTDLWIGALIALAAYAVTRGWWRRAAIAAGVAAALKATPILWVSYFVVRRRWGPAVLMLAVVFAANLLPDALSRPPGGGLWLERWAGAVLWPSIGAPGPFFTAAIYNQSLAGTFYRLCGLAWPEPGAFDSAPVLGSTFSAAAVPWIIRCAQAVVATVGGAALIAAGDDQRAGRVVPAAALDASILMMLMVLLSPVSSKPHFVIVLLPAFCLARTALVDGDRVSGGFLALALAASVVSHRTLVGAAIGEPAQWAGGITLCALALLLGCSLARLRGQGLAPARPAGTRRSCRP